MARGRAMFPHVPLQQRIAPQFVRVAQILRFLTGTVQHPGDRIIGNAATLARPRKFSQRCVESELEKLADTQRYCMTIDAVGRSDRTIAHSASRIQENGGVKYPPFLFAP